MKHQRTRDPRTATATRILTNRLTIIALLVSSFIGVPLPGNADAAEHQSPNILILMADDLTYTHLPLYGGQNVATPNIDRLASDGMTFNKAFVSTSMCKPARASLYTGLFPAQNGVCWNHAPARSDIKSVFHYLGDAGYRVGLAGKTHVSPRSVFPYERVPGVEGGAVSETAKFDPSGIRRFIGKDKAQPFFLTVAFTSPHVVWTVGDPDQFDAKALKLPPHYVDTPQTRQDFTRYLAEVAELDRKIGRVLKILTETGQADETLVLFTSEQGGQWPGAKWTNWNLGVHTALVARWPGPIEAGARTDALVQYVDVVPTLLEAAGQNPRHHDLDGRSFLSVLTGKHESHRQYAYFMHNNVPEGPPYPIRAVTDGRFHYIRNLRPDRTYIEKHLFGVPHHNRYFTSWFRVSDKNEHAYEMIDRFMHRPGEELYDINEDPYELDNLVPRRDYRQVKARLADALDDWMREQGEPGAPLDSWEALGAARQGKHFDNSDMKSHLESTRDD